MECSSLFFPIRIKEEPLEEEYDTSHTGVPDYYNPYDYPIKPEPLVPSSEMVTGITGHVTSQMVQNHHHLPPLHQVPPQHHHPQQQQHLNDGKEPPNRVNAATANTNINNNNSSKSKNSKKRKIKSEYNDGNESEVAINNHNSNSNNSINSNNGNCNTNNNNNSKKKGKQDKVNEVFKERKKVDRFNGTPEEEIAKRTLPDHLAPNLDIVVIGINPGLFAAFKGHHYAGPGNHFWKCLFLAGLIQEPMTSDDDFKLLDSGIGFTNIVSRTTRGSADLTRKEIKDGSKVLLEKLKKYQPKIAVFNGKGIYEVFSGKKNFDFGKQPEPIEGTNSIIYVMPSSSARCAQLPRAVDKVPFYVALKKLRDHLIGNLPNLQDSEVTFPDVKLKIETDDSAKQEPVDHSKEDMDDSVHQRKKTTPRKRRILPFNR